MKKFVAVLVAVMVGVVLSTTPVFANRKCPGGDCSGSGQWDPKDPRQPASGTISSSLGSGNITGANEVKVVSHLKCSAVQVWYGDGDSGKLTNGKITFFFPSEAEKRKYVRSQKPAPVELINRALQLPITPASVGRQQWLKFTPKPL